MAETTRISVALTPDDHHEVLKLARRCNTSASGLGQLAIRHMLLAERSGTIPMLPETPPNAPGLFGRFRPRPRSDHGTSCPQPEPPAKVRISVGLTEDQAIRISALARRCNISVAALGELALKYILVQAANGAIPLLPTPAADIEPENNLERSRMGRMVSHAAWSEDAIAELQRCNTVSEELDRQEKRSRLTIVSGQVPTISPEAG